MYRATVELFMRGKPIKKGQIIPADYPEKDLALAIGRKWAVPDGEPIVDPTRPTAPPPDAPLEPSGWKEPPAPIEPPEEEPPVESADEDVSRETLLSALPFLSELAADSLMTADIHTIEDLKGWDEDQLRELQGIGGATAEKLVEAYETADRED